MSALTVVQSADRVSKELHTRIMEQRIVGRLNLPPHTVESIRGKVDQLEARLPPNWVDEQVRLAEERAKRLGHPGVSPDVHPLASLIQRVRTQFELFDMSNPVNATQDMLTATGLGSDIQFLEEREVEGLSERVAMLHSEDRGSFEGTCFEIRSVVTLARLGHSVAFLSTRSDAELKTPDLLIDGNVEGECKTTDPLSSRDRSNEDGWQQIERAYFKALEANGKYGTVAVESDRDLTPDDRETSKARFTRSCKPGSKRHPGVARVWVARIGYEAPAT